MSVRVLALLGGCVIALGALAGFFLLGRGKAAGQAAEETRLAPVKVVAARVFRFGEWTELVGATQPLPDKAAHVSAAVGGRILSILGDGKYQTLVEGGPVQANQILAQLDDSVPRAYREQLAALHANLERQKKQSRAAEPALSIVQAALKALDVQIAQFSIRAPFAGVLGPLQVTPGQAIRVGTTVADVINLNKIDVLCYVPPRTVSRLGVGQTARLVDLSKEESRVLARRASEVDSIPRLRVGLTGPPSRYCGRVIFIAAQADPDTGNFAVRVRFANPDGRLRLNSVERVQVLTQPEKDRLTIPEDALREDQDPPVVMAAQNSKLQKTASASSTMRVATALGLRPVIGVRDRELRLVEIRQLRGAQTGDLVSIRDIRFIVEGAGGLHDNDGLKVDGDPRPHDDALNLEQTLLNAVHARVTIPGETIWALAFSPDGKTLASGGQDGAIKFWESATGKNSGVMPRRTKSVKVLAFRPDGKVLAAGIRDGTIALWDVAERKHLLSIEAHYHFRNLVSLAFSPDGKTLASVGRDEPVIKLWDPVSGKLSATLGGHKDYIGPILYSPDSKFLVSGAEDATIRTWDARSGKNLQVLEGSPAAVTALALLPDGSDLLSWSKIPGKGENASGKSAVLTWDIHSRRNVATVEGSSGQKTPFLGAFSPSARILAWAAGEPVITLWDTASARMVGILQGHTDKVVALAFSPDGKVVASASEDNTIRIWDLP